MKKAPFSRFAVLSPWGERNFRVEYPLFRFAVLSPWGERKRYYIF
jgi:hypothetical protein